MATVATATGDRFISNLRIADSHWDKFRGLMLDKSLRPDEGLLIRNCRSIHCCFMLIAIDVLFLAPDGTIVYIKPEMRPWTFSPYVRSAQDVLECYPGTVRRFDLAVGQRLQIQT